MTFAYMVVRMKSVHVGSQPCRHTANIQWVIKKKKVLHPIPRDSDSIAMSGEFKICLHVVLRFGFAKHCIKTLKEK